MGYSLRDNPILTSTQKGLLEAFAAHPIAEAYHLAGGTAIAAFYLEHRLSEDLDLFAPKPWALPEVEKFILSVPGLREHSLSTLYDRRVFFLRFEDGSQLKTEFTKFEFPLLEPLRTLTGKLRVESLRDLLAGKLAALIDRVEPRDFADVYAVLRAEKDPEKILRRGVRDLGRKFGLPNPSALLQQAFARSTKVGGWPPFRGPFDPAAAKADFLDWARLLVE